MDTLFAALDLAGVFVFAISGALAASRKQLDIFGFHFIATVTAIGGGTLRDVLLGRTPVFWVEHPHFIWLTGVAALVVYFLAPAVQSREKLLIWADAIGLAIFAAGGTIVTQQTGAPPGVVILMGAVSATFGGLIRDIVCREMPLLLRKEIYITAAAAGSALMVVLEQLGQPVEVGYLACVVVTFVIRGLAIRYSLSLPAYRPRPAGGGTVGT
ncbi:Uncharacterized membrane protein YeiH [Tistlia consotensis]|uniref:Uncharacterized membrane protein YeiH n=1 Tax=Tistlia consotensis USBA 355 TaxID=560819 RepID=A0A1Y6BR08_9PROT|nr:trimeric intracellular cation channel family protein [Tistlia consotensis]SMF16601.1 Uncharacterized membrane protein YeiH [Tistlia consotensis USBA 355]SNR40992.1 Uncharacterized membrane protein YeiH [Tistlia consotensis]